MKSAALTALILLASVPALAEQRHPAPPSPPAAPFVPPVLSTGPINTFRPPSSTPAPAGPFDARPGTYSPRYNDPNRRPPNSVPYYPGAFGIGAYVPPAAPEQKAPPAAVPVPEPPRTHEPPASVPEVPRVAALHPDLFYVIPGCYAGNRLPKPERLPKGCDLAKMTTNPIR